MARERDRGLTTDDTVYLNTVPSLERLDRRPSLRAETAIDARSD